MTETDHTPNLTNDKIARRAFLKGSVLTGVATVVGVAACKIQSVIEQAGGLANVVSLIKNRQEKPATMSMSTAPPAIDTEATTEAHGATLTYEAATKTEYGFCITDMDVLPLDQLEAVSSAAQGGGELPDLLQSLTMMVTAVTATENASSPQMLTELKKGSSVVFKDGDNQYTYEEVLQQIQGLDDNAIVTISENNLTKERLLAVGNDGTTLLQKIFNQHDSLAKERLYQATQTQTEEDYYSGVLHLPEGLYSAFTLPGLVEEKMAAVSQELVNQQIIYHRSYWPQEKKDQIKKLQDEANIESVQSGKDWDKIALEKIMPVYQSLKPDQRSTMENAAREQIVLRQLSKQTDEYATFYMPESRALVDIQIDGQSLVLLADEKPQFTNQVYVTPQGLSPEGTSQKGYLVLVKVPVGCSSMKVVSADLNQSTPEDLYRIYSSVADLSHDEEPSYIKVTGKNGQYQIVYNYQYQH